jgi:uncharacterized protein YecE (DUF72 family)
VYPKGCKSTDYLYYYGKQFNTIELNTTHYRTPSVVDIEKWKSQTPKDFRFAPKMLQTISHAKKLSMGTGLPEQFIESILNFDEKLGVCFMQMPPTIGYNDLNILDIFLNKYSKHLHLAIEIRNEQLFANLNHLNTFFKILESYKVSTVITDVAGRRDVLHQRLTTSTAIIRFVGNALHKTDYSRIDDWVARLNDWFSMGLHEVYFFTHEPDNILAPRLARYLFEKIQATFPAQLRGVVFEEEQQSAQQSLF